MKTLATALVGVLGVCVLAGSPAVAAPFDPFGSDGNDAYYQDQYRSNQYRQDPNRRNMRPTNYDPYAGQGYGSSYGYGYGQGAQSAPQAQVAPIPREVVSVAGTYAPGTILVSTSERRLYFMLGNGQALRYGVGVGRPGFEWSGTKTITAKKEWPSWVPPKAMLARRPDLPHYMAGGVENPLGARAMYIGGTEYRIHGSNEPDTIGQAVSSGCIRMTNDDVTDLYGRVRVGAKVIVTN